MVTYGDGVADINIKELVKFHKSHNKIITISGVHPPARFGEIIEKNGRVISFEEKPQTSIGLINGGFMVAEPEVFNYLRDDDSLVFEREPLESIANDMKLNAYKHHGFWQCMDTLRDKQYLERLWESGNAPWKVWE